MNKNSWWFINLLLEPFPISSSTHEQLLSIFSLPFWCSSYLQNFSPLLYLISASATLFFVAPFIALHMWYSWCSLSYAFNLAIFLACAELPLPCMYTLLSCIPASVLVTPIGLLASAFAVGSTWYAPVGTSFSQFFLTPSIGLRIGLAQAFALLPGCSRFGLTFCVARWCGIERMDALYLSFCLIVPFFLVRGIVDFFQAYRSLPAFDLKFFVIVGLLIALTYAGFLTVRLYVAFDKLFLFAPYLLILSLGTAFKFYWSSMSL